MTIRIRIPQVTFNSIGEWQRKLRIARRRLDDRTQVHQEIKDYLVDRWDVNFDTEGGIYGGWAPLADWTVESRGGSTNPILVRNGDLWVSFISQNEAGTVTSNTNFWEFQNEEGGPYPFSHHTGYPNPLPNRRPIPSRVLWAINDEDEERMTKEFEEWLDEIIAMF